MSRAAKTTGMWLIAQHWTHTPYPCRCKREKACWTSVSNPDGHPGYWCPCWGRTDLDGMPAYCCASGHPIHAGQSIPTAAPLVATDTQPASTEEPHNGRTGHTADRQVAHRSRPAPNRRAVPVQLPDEGTVPHLLAPGVPVPV